MVTSPKNWLKLIVEDTKFTFEPACPECRVGFEPLQVLVEFKSKNWRAVTFYGFKDAAGILQTSVPQLRFTASDPPGFVQELRFLCAVEADAFATYSVDIERERPIAETLSIDPTILMRKGMG